MKKGFTLIELLAVIIILAILMIIAVPNILSTLATARSSAFIAQAQSIYKSAEKQYVVDSMSGSASACYDKSNLNLSSISSTVSFTVQMNSSTGSVSGLTITDTGQQLTASGTTINNITLGTYNSSELSCSGSSTTTPTATTYTVTVSVTGGTSTPSSKEVTSGESETFTISANSGYDLSTATVTGTGCSLSANKSTLTVSNVTSAVTCTVIIEEGHIGPTLVAATSGDTHKGIVYLDPKDLTATCTSTSTLTTTNTGCKKFYIYDDSGSTYKMIMWKNTTNTVAWNSTCTSSNTATCGTMNEVATTLSTDTAGWQGNPRLITADEVADIVGISNATTATPPGTGWTASKTYTSSVTDVSTQTSWFYLDGSGDSYSSSNGWQKQRANSTNKSSYAWLYNYTVGCTSYGCDYEYGSLNSTFGYWTSTTRSGMSYNVWTVNYDGTMGGDNASTSGASGLRPVIEISKSSIS